MQEALADRDRQARMTALHMKGLYQRMEVLEAAAKGLPIQLPQVWRVWEGGQHEGWRLREVKCGGDLPSKLQ